jgi:bifunctional oligoribonuclease and PAP phosphatase NrnA
MSSAATPDPVIPPELLAFIRDHTTFYLAGHIDPDGDCIASALAFASYLGRVHGKRARCLNVGPFHRREIRQYEGDFAGHLDRGERDRAPAPAAIVLDCSTPDRIGSLQGDLAGLPLAVIDHHAATESYGDVRLVIPTAAATCYLIQLLMEQAGGSISAEEAELLLFGIATDTGYFRHLEPGASGVLSAVSRLMVAGASPRRAHAQMFGGHSASSRVLLGVLLARAEFFCDGTGVITWETREDVDRYGRENRDSDTLYQLLFGISGVRTAALVRYETETSVSGSLRSIDDLDVRGIARTFGGGGHQRAAGFTADMDLMEAVSRVRAELESALRSSQRNGT